MFCLKTQTLVPAVWARNPIEIFMGGLEGMRELAAWDFSPLCCTLCVDVGDLRGLCQIFLSCPIHAKVSPSCEIPPPHHRGLRWHNMVVSVDDTRLFGWAACLGIIDSLRCAARRCVRTRFQHRRTKPLKPLITLKIHRVFVRFASLSWACNLCDSKFSAARKGHLQHFVVLL